MSTKNNLAIFIILSCIFMQLVNIPDVLFNTQLISLIFIMYVFSGWTRQLSIMGILLLPTVTNYFYSNLILFSNIDPVYYITTSIATSIALIISLYFLIKPREEDMTSWWQGAIIAHLVFYIMYIPLFNSTTILNLKDVLLLYVSSADMVLTVMAGNMIYGMLLIVAYIATTENIVFKEGINGPKTNS